MLKPERLMIDPPEGWRYGFPKALPPEHRHRTMEWLVEEGYPAEVITKYGLHFYCRVWNEPEGEDEKD